MLRFAAQGFITAVGEDNSGVLKICQMPIKVHLDTPWPLQRVPQHATPHRYSPLLYELIVFAIARCSSKRPPQV